MSTDADRIIQREYERALALLDPTADSAYDDGYLDGLHYALRILQAPEK
jgi:hypothetical protein